MEKNRHVPYRIMKIKQDNEDVRTFNMEKKGNAKEARPGNYIMIWIPEVSENPFSIAGTNPLRVMVKKVGDDSSFTSHMFRKKEGDEIFIRGPYGNSFLDFRKSGRDSYLVAGGIGIAPILSLIPEIGKEKTKLWLGFRTANQVIVPSEIACLDYTILTDDGTYGGEGFVTSMFDKAEIEEGSQFFICGPEKMMKTAAKKALNYTDPEDVILSVERYMKCGYGICGGCEIKGVDRTYSVCTDGPIFTYEQLMDGDFGKFHRTKSGMKIPL